MSKYVIDIPKTVGMLEKVGSVHYMYFDGIQVQTIVLKSDEIEELNSDYINEHFGQLQDEAYKRGLQDGKEAIHKGCEGCKYEGGTVERNPCFTCCNYYQNYWTAKKQDDEIKVGDEVEIIGTGDKFFIVGYEGDCICGFASGAKTCRVQPVFAQKTGRHFDIEKLLEAMKE